MADEQNPDIAKLQEQLADLQRFSETLQRQIYGIVDQLNALQQFSQTLQQQNISTADQLNALQQFVMRVAAASSVENAMEKGFETIAAQLEPLQYLVRSRRLDPAAADDLQLLLEPLRRREWLNEDEITDTISEQARKSALILGRRHAP